MGAAAAILLLLLGWVGLSSINFSEWAPWTETQQEVKTEEERQAKTAAESQVKHNTERAEQQRIAATKAEDDKKAKAAAAEAEQQRIEVGGQVDKPLEWTWEEFTALPSEDVTVDIHCVTKWSKLDTTWRGVSVDTLLKEPPAK